MTELEFDEIAEGIQQERLNSQLYVSDTFISHRDFDICVFVEKSSNDLQREAIQADDVEHGVQKTAVLRHHFLSNFA